MTEPRLSVVIAAVNDDRLLGVTLDALNDEPDTEVIVVGRGPSGPRLRADHPRVRWVEHAGQAGIPQMRACGARQARGELIGFLEDHAPAMPGWAQAARELHRDGWAAVGGSVAEGARGPVAEASFLCEYARYMEPVPEGAHADLPGNNIVYKREHLLRHLDEMESGRWESWVNAKLAAEGQSLASTNRMAVRHLKPIGFLEYVAQRWHFSRSYAGMRRRDRPWPWRVAYGCGALLLPGLLTARIAQAVTRKGKSTRRLIAALPLILLFQTVGAAGELVGAWFGPGRSLERVE